MAATMPSESTITGATNFAVEQAIKKSSVVELIFIGHELTESTIRMLREGIIKTLSVRPASPSI